MHNDNQKPVIVIATPHSRYDLLIDKVDRRLNGYKIIRIRTREELTLTQIMELNPKKIFFPHWSWIIPEEIFTQFECIVFHMTDLPYGRGGSPLQNLIIRGHTETKLTAFRCVRGLDAGPVYLKKDLALYGTAEEIFTRASVLMEEMIIEIVEKSIIPVEQNGEIVIFKRRLPQEGNVAQLKDINQIYDYIRMLDAEGYPKAFIESEHFLFEFTDAVLEGSSIESKVRIRRKDL